MKRLLVAAAVCVLTVGQAWGEATGVLDVDVSPHGAGYKLSNKSFSIVFPSKPQVQPQNAPTPQGGNLVTALGIVERGKSSFGVVYMPIPADTGFNAKKGLAGARDGALKNLNAKVTKSSQVNFGGVNGELVAAAGSFNGVSVSIDAWFAWHEAQRTLIGAFRVDVAGAATDHGDELFKSIRFNGINAPGFADFVLKRSGKSYLLTGKDLTVGFAGEPTLETEAKRENGAASMTATWELNGMSVGVFAVYVPADGNADVKALHELFRGGVKNKLATATVIAENNDKLSGKPAYSSRLSYVEGGKQYSMKMVSTISPKSRLFITAFGYWATGDKAAEATASAWLKVIKLR